MHRPSSAIFAFAAVVVVAALMESPAYANTKIAPTEAEAGHPFTLIDSNQRLLDGSVAVFRYAGLRTVLPLRTRKPYNTAHGRLPIEMYGGVYTVYLRQPDGSESEIGPFTVLGAGAPPPSVVPDFGPSGTSFTITDPLARMQAGDVVVFYAEGTDPVTYGVVAPAVVSDDGTSLSATVPGGAAQGLQNFVSVRAVGGSPRFGDLGFFVTAPPTSIQLALNNALDTTIQFAAPGSSDWRILGSVSNLGSSEWTQHDLSLVLPADWRVTGGTMEFDGVMVPCTGAGCGDSNLQTFVLERTYVPGEQRSFAFTVTVGDSKGLYDVAARSRGTAPAGSADVSVPNAVVVPVAAVRTLWPTLVCPIGPNATQILGTSEPNVAIAVLFDGVAGGTATAGGDGSWTVTNHSGQLPLAIGTTVQAVATAVGQLASVPSSSCIVSGM